MRSLFFRFFFINLSFQPFSFVTLAGGLDKAIYHPFCGGLFSSFSLDSIFRRTVNPAAIVSVNGKYMRLETVLGQAMNVIRIHPHFAAIWPVFAKWNRWDYQQDRRTFCSSVSLGSDLRADLSVGSEGDLQVVIVPINTLRFDEERIVGIYTTDVLLQAMIDTHAVYPKFKIVPHLASRGHLNGLKLEKVRFVVGYDDASLYFFHAVFEAFMRGEDVPNEHVGISDFVFSTETFIQRLASDNSGAQLSDEQIIEQDVATIDAAISRLMADRYKVNAKVVNGLIADDHFRFLDKEWTQLVESQLAKLKVLELSLRSSNPHRERVFVLIAAVKLYLKQTKIVMK